jgi:N6-L-threonylcarbamoyladenine synthase
MLLANVLKASKLQHTNNIAICGGVSANSYIRQEFSCFGDENGFHIYYPSLNLCTDNAAMIATAAFYKYMNGQTSNLKLNAIANLKIGDEA